MARKVYTCSRIWCKLRDGKRIYRMVENVFRGLFDAETAQVISVADFMVCIAGSLAIGFILSVMYILKSRPDYTLV